MSMKYFRWDFELTNFKKGRSSFEQVKALEIVFTENSLTEENGGICFPWHCRLIVFWQFGIVYYFTLSLITVCCCLKWLFWLRINNMHFIYQGLSKCADLKFKWQILSCFQLKIQHFKQIQLHDKVVLLKTRTLKVHFLSNL